MNLAALSHDRLLRAGFLLGALAALLVGLSGFADLAEGLAREGGGRTRLGVEDLVPLIGASALVLLVSTMIVSFGWARLVGVLVTTAVAFVAGIEGLRGRVSDQFVPDERTTLLAGGLLLAAAFWIALIGVGVALVAMRQLALSREREDDQAIEALPTRPDGRPARVSGKAGLGLALAVAGIFAPVLSGLAVAVSLSALGDVHAHDGRLGGRPIAVAGVVVGIAGLSLLAAFLGVGPLVLTPGT